MSDEQKYTIQGLDEYIRQGEPQQRERSEAWKVAPKCIIERRTASKVQKLHFRRGGGLRIMHVNPTATQKEIATAIGKSERTVKTITVALQEKLIVKRVNGKRNGYWEFVE